MQIEAIFKALKLPDPQCKTGTLVSYSPIDGEPLARLEVSSEKHSLAAIDYASKAFGKWKSIPAPQRGELVRRFAQSLREHKAMLGKLISLECGKIRSEGEGEVQEMIDICDFAVGLSRQLYGLTIASERPSHALRELWQPLGPVAIITAFNFPMAVWAWNASLALVCGNSIIWKPSEKTPLCAIACQGILQSSIDQFDSAPPKLSQVLIGEQETGGLLVNSEAIPLVSATGSCSMGRKVGQQVAKRFGRSLLELGGNNAVIVSNKADLDMAVRAIVFGAAGTAGQRCTTTRRVFAHSDIFAELKDRLLTTFPKLNVGNPLSADTLLGPLIDQNAYVAMQQQLTVLRTQGCIVHGGERRLAEAFPKAYYVQPALVEANGVIDNSFVETFAPILYLFEYTELKEAISRQNAVPQGLSSAIFTLDIREAEYFLSAEGSDCGIANVNVGTSGAEIGGAFGGEKDTGGGRESGSDAWKNYMRRMTATINYSDALPLAQGVSFDFN